MNKASVKQIIILLVICGVLVVLLTMWLQKTTGNTQLLLSDEAALTELDGPLSAESIDQIKKDNEVAITNTMNPKAIITTNYGVIEIELYEDMMPITAGNFAKLAEEGYYNGTKFHRIIDGFMIQGGDPNTKGDNLESYGTGGPGYTIADEYNADHKLNNLRGTIAMANSGPNTGGSQFFINGSDNNFLDPKHPVFGRVVEGQDVVDKISKVEVTPTSRGEASLPVEPVVLESVTIERQ